MTPKTRPKSKKPLFIAIVEQPLFVDSSKVIESVLFYRRDRHQNLTAPTQIALTL